MPNLKVPVGFWGEREENELLLRMIAPLRIDNEVGSGIFCADNIITFLHHVGFRADERFAEAMTKHTTKPLELYAAWRKHIVCWAIGSCSMLEGCLVEAGTADGHTALVALDYVAAARAKPFWLYDAFDLNTGPPYKSRPPTMPYAQIARRFASFPNVRLVQGILPDVLDQSAPDRICFLHLDVGAAEVEAAVLDRLFPILAPGAMVISASYGLMSAYAGIKPALDAVASRHGRVFLEIPTGQGLLLNR